MGRGGSRSFPDVLAVLSPCPKSSNLNGYNDLHTDQHVMYLQWTSMDASPLEG